MEKETVDRAVVEVCDWIKELLLTKNEAYGNSVGDPIQIFSKVARDEQMNVRIDDKLSRIARGKEFPGDDTIDDLIGYLILKKAMNNIKTALLIKERTL
ncbi:MAG: hypothetical protein KKC20_19695 [Proteobacteria bacterium]|nr:hypothetical protein [Pseudomonadota bacterium]